MTVKIDYILNANLARASELLRSGLFEDCQRLCQENVRLFQSIAEPSGRQIAAFSESQALCGECAFLAGDFAAARTRYRKAVHLAPRESAYWQRLAQSCARLYKNTGDVRFDSESAAAARNVFLLQKKAGTAALHAGKSGSENAINHRVCS